MIDMTEKEIDIKNCLVSSGAIVCIGNIKDKNGSLIQQFEAGERGYVSEKDIERGLVKTKEVEEGTLTYRERVATPGTAIIELFE